MRLRVIYTPAQIAAFRPGSEEACAVVDQLRATSTQVTALAAGAASILAVRTVEEARALRQRLPGALLAGERKGIPLEGFDLGNSPREMTAERVAGRTIVHTTTNGTVALLACAGARAIHAASFLNLSAVAAALAGEEEVALLCAGTEADFSLEDALVVSALAERLQPAHPAAALWRAWGADPAAFLRRTVNGRRLQTLGLGEDIGATLPIDRFALVPRGEVEDHAGLRAVRLTA
ncbi:MAG: 2-phosphosulfolactate phosphatase [Verrucomicrobium sp.]|nr:2-phosphosulfolactate phosphatase [Verrucomicrobium sp.]